MICERCGHRKRANPLLILCQGIGTLLILPFLNHWHADHIPFSGDPEVWARGLLWYWWGAAIFGSLSIFFGLLGTALFLFDPDGWHSQTNGLRK